MTAFTDYAENEIAKGMFRSHGITAWAASTAYTLGQRVHSTNSYGPYVFECTTAGTSAATQPTWPTALGGTVADGTATWTCFFVGTLKRPIYIGLILANKGYWAASTVYALNDYVLPVTPNARLYKCTTAGTSGASQPTWPITDGGTVADGTVTWTEQTTALDGGTIPEVTGGAYARVQLDPADANWTAPASGDATSKNASAITFPAPTANWSVIYGFAEYDKATAGNSSVRAALSTPKTINSGDAAPSFAINALTCQIDN